MGNYRKIIQNSRKHRGSDGTWRSKEISVELSFTADLAVWIGHALRFLDNRIEEIV